MTVGAPDGTAERVAAPITFEPIGFADVPGWSADDAGAAYPAFLKSAKRLADGGAKAGTPPGLIAVCRRALALPTTDGATARAFFESNFIPHRVRHTGPPGLLTGYYEPVLAGSPVVSAAYPVPVYRRPPELVNIVAEHARATSQFTHGRRTPAGLEPYFSRAEIEDGALRGRGLELLYLADPVELFFMQVQGSGRIEFADGTSVRLSYDGKNGYPYTSIGRVLIDQGAFSSEAMTLEALRQWLKADVDRGRALMRRNLSFVFFRELEGAEAEGPIGALAIALTPGRSLAVDAGFHALGHPVFVSAPDLVHATPDRTPLARLMVAQDVGSAIRGPERGDYYFGSGDAAGSCAGITKHACAFTVLRAREDSGHDSGGAP